MIEIKKIVYATLLITCLFNVGIARGYVQTDNHTQTDIEINTAKRSFNFKGSKINFLVATNRMGGDFTFLKGSYYSSISETVYRP